MINDWLKNTYKKQTDYYTEKNPWQTHNSYQIQDLAYKPLRTEKQLQANMVQYRNLVRFTHVTHVYKSASTEHIIYSKLR